MYLVNTYLHVAELSALVKLDANRVKCLMQVNRLLCCFIPMRFQWVHSIESRLLKESYELWSFSTVTQPTKSNFRSFLCELCPMARIMWAYRSYMQTAYSLYMPAFSMPYGVAAAAIVGLSDNHDIPPVWPKTYEMDLGIPNTMSYSKTCLV